MVQRIAIKRREMVMSSPVAARILDPNTRCARLRNALFMKAYINVLTRCEAESEV